MDLNQYSQSAAQPGLSVEVIANLEVPVPPLREQRAVADFLDSETARIDGLIAKKERLIELLEERRRNSISSAVTKGLRASAQYKDSGYEWLGVVPAHWQICDLKRVLAAADYGIGESLDREGTYAILRMGNLQEERLTFDDLAYVSELESEMLLRDRDILINRTNSLAQVGKAAMFNAAPIENVSFAGYLVRLRCNEKMLPEYLIRFLNRPETLSRARSLALPAIGQANLNPNRYGYLKICVPPPSEQKEIAEFADLQSARTCASTATMAEGIAKLREYRTSLIFAAVTGQLDVRTYRKEPEAVLESTA